ncbi:MAG: hypothetical protein WBF23_10980, partial [Methyloceanibacter sp.]
SSPGCTTASGAGSSSCPSSGPGRASATAGSATAGSSPGRASSRRGGAHECSWGRDDQGDPGIGLGGMHDGAI